MSDPLTEAARAVVADARKCYPAGLPRGVYVTVHSDALRALERALADLVSPTETLLESVPGVPPARPSGADEQQEPVMATKKAAPKQAPKVKTAKPKAVKRPAAKKPAGGNGGATA